MEMPGIPDHVEFWQRARRHLLKYGGEFVDFLVERGICQAHHLYDRAHFAEAAERDPVEALLLEQSALRGPFGQIQDH